MSCRCLPDVDSDMNYHFFDLLKEDSIPRSVLTDEIRENKLYDDL